MLRNRFGLGVMTILILMVGLSLSSCSKKEPAARQESADATPALTPPAPDVVMTDDAGGMVPLPLVLPKPMFVGTPTNIEGVEHLAKPLGKARDPFLAPAGVTNVALNKPVTSSVEEPIMGELAWITDGDKEATDGSLVELDPFTVHVTVDLEDSYEIFAVVAWHYHKNSRVYFDVIAQVSDDPDFIENVTTLFNNDIDNSSGQGVGEDMHYVETNEGKLIDAKGVKGRYVRLYSMGNNSNDQNHYLEVEVFGRPAQ
ncbi:hypothetical protein ACFL6U_02225 [Planctomycetota bacterium]